MAKLKDIDVDDYYKACIDFEPALISDEFTRLAADFGYWNEKTAEAGKVLMLAEWEEKKTEAKLYLKYKQAEPGAKAPTEAAVDAAIRTDPIFEELHLETVEAQYTHDQLTGRLKTLSKKADMLVSMGAHIRQEKDGDKRIMERDHLRRMTEGG